MTRTRAIIAGAAIAALLAAFLGGRYSRTPQVQTKDVVRTVTDTKAAEQLSVALAELDRTRKDLATWQARASSAESHVNTVVRWKYLPGGVVEVTKETTKDAKQEASSQGGTHETTDATKSLDMKLHRDVVIQEHQVVIETHTSTPVLPKWSFGISGGVARDHAVPIFGPVIVGGQIGHRLGGPFSLDLSANTSPAATLTLRIDL